MIPSTSSSTRAILLLSLATLVTAQTSRPVVAIGQPCTLAGNKLTATSHQFISECGPTAFCDATALVCKPLGCRVQEFPFGFKPDQKLPDLCPDGQFCPDEGDQCLPWQPVGQPCQLNRDDQCQPAPNAADIGSSWNHQGAVCLHFQCYWQNVTLGSNCTVDNVAFTGYRMNSSEFATIISRDNCLSPNLYCDAIDLTCKQAADLAQPCNADKMCLSHNCGTDNTCHLPAGTVIKISLWEYIVTGAGILGFIFAILLTLFLIHRKHRAARQKEIKEYFHEQTTYRSSIIALHTAARDRTSLYSGSESRFSQYDEHGQMVYHDDESERHLMDSDRRRASRLRESTVFDAEDDSDDETAQKKGLLQSGGRAGPSGARGIYGAAASRDSFGSRASLDQTPRQSVDYGGPGRGPYQAVGGRPSLDLPPGAKMGEFKDPWGN